MTVSLDVAVVLLAIVRAEWSDQSVFVARLVLARRPADSLEPLVELVVAGLVRLARANGLGGRLLREQVSRACL